MLPTFGGEDLLVHASLGESRIVPGLLAGLLALNGYLAVRNFAFTFFGPGMPTSEIAEDGHRDSAKAPLSAPASSKIALTGTPQSGRERREGWELLAFDLTKEEAEFLKARLESLEQASVLGRAARRAARQATSGDAPWSDPLIVDAAQDLGGVTAAQLGRAQLASSLAELVRATYAALVEKVRNRTVSPVQKKAIENPRSDQLGRHPELCSRLGLLGLGDEHVVRVAERRSHLQGSRPELRG